MNTLLHLAARVLRDPDSLVTDDPEELASSAPHLLALTIGGAAAWAMMVASYRGGLMYLYAPIKAPFLLLIPLAVCLPAIRALFDPEGDRLTSPLVASAGLVGMARTALLAASFAPVIWLWYSFDPGYHDAVLGAAGSLALAGLPGLLTILRAMRPGIITAGTSLLALALLGGVTAQTGWLLRPFIARPTAEVTFLRPVESDITSVLTTTESALGHYDGWDASPSGVIGRGLQEER